MNKTKQFEGQRHSSRVSTFDKDNRTNIKALVIIIVIILLTVFMLGCSKNRFTSYKQVTDYCYNKTIQGSCGIERCIMLNVAEFSDNIKFSSEKNYLQCELQNCNNKGNETR